LSEAAATGVGPDLLFTKGSPGFVSWEKTEEREMARIGSRNRGKTVSMVWRMEWTDIARLP
jgi:hypothetical protein